MKIAMGTNDGLRLNDGFFENSRQFRIIEFKNGEIVSDTMRANPYAESIDPASFQRQTDKMMTLLEDCSLFMGQLMHKDFVAAFRAEKIDCIVTDIDDINQALSLYLYDESERFKYYSLQSGAFVPCSRRSPS